MLPEYTCTYTFLGENVSFDFLPVYVLVPTTKMLKESLPRNGGQNSKIRSIKLLIYAQINLQPVKLHIFKVLSTPALVKHLFHFFKQTSEVH